MAAFRAAALSLPQAWRGQHQQALPLSHCACVSAFLSARRRQQLELVSSRQHASLSWKLPGFSRSVASPEADLATAAGLEEVVIAWDGEGDNIYITADYLNWETRLPLKKNASGGFTLTQKLAPGKYQVKFIVDEEWRHSPALPIVHDDRGGYNNEITVGDVESTEGGAAGTAAVPKQDGVGRASPQVVGTSEFASAAASRVPPGGETSAAEPAVPSPSAIPASEGSTKAEVELPRRLAAAASAPPAAAAPAPKPAVGKVAPKKAAAKPFATSIVEDVIPALKKTFEAEQDLTDIKLVLQDNQLQGSFIKNGVPYAFWALFPDGKFEGSRGFAFASYGNVPSTVEPFLIDEKKITPDLLVFWIKKRLFAQKILSVN